MPVRRCQPPRRGALTRHTTAGGPEPLRGSGRPLLNHAVMSRVLAIVRGRCLERLFERRPDGLIATAMAGDPKQHHPGPKSCRNHPATYSAAIVPITTATMNLTYQTTVLMRSAAGRGLAVIGHGLAHHPARGLLQDDDAAAGGPNFAVDSRNAEDPRDEGARALPRLQRADHRRVDNPGRAPRLSPNVLATDRVAGRRMPEED